MLTLTISNTCSTLELTQNASTVYDGKISSLPLCVLSDLRGEFPANYDRANKQYSGENMSQETILYQGNVHIYLQGEKALRPTGSERKDQVAYFIGSKKSKLLIRDFRKRPIQAAQRSHSGIEGSEFADAFNQPAYAEVSIAKKGNEPEKVEINLLPTDEREDFPVLWLGIMNDLMMPMLDIEWEILRPINPEKIAFTAMVRFDRKETAVP